MDKDKQPGINFEAVFMIDEYFTRTSYQPEHISTTLNFNAKMVPRDDSKYENHISTELKCLSDDTEIVLELNFTYVGIFSSINGEENMELQEFMVVNSAALMLPFIREHITSITAKAGVDPIIIPPVNINAMLRKQSGMDEAGDQATDETQQRLLQ